MTICIGAKCGKEFTKHHPLQLYCSHTCRLAHAHPVGGKSGRSRPGRGVPRILLERLADCYPGGIPITLLYELVHGREAAKAKRFHPDHTIPTAALLDVLKDKS